MKNHRMRAGFVLGLSMCLVFLGGLAGCGDATKSTTQEMGQTQVDVNDTPIDVSDDPYRMQQRPRYERVDGVEGKLVFAGSDILNGLMACHMEDFVAHYPNVELDIWGKGSTTATGGMLRGVDFGMTSRELKAKEIDALREQFGYEPTRLRIAVDMLAIFVHKDNPIAKRGLTLAELDAIYSSTQKRGHANITTWGDLGLKGEWADKAITLYGRNSASGTYGYFKRYALNKGQYKDTVKEQPGSAAVVDGVRKDKNGIGYSGVGYKTAGVVVVPLREAMDREWVLPTHRNARDYPLSRYLNLYVMKDPKLPLSENKMEFIRYIYSREGAQNTLKTGFLPVHLGIRQWDLQRVSYVDDSEGRKTQSLQDAIKKRYAYRTVGGLEGSYKSVGADALNNIMTFMMEDLMQRYPDVEAEVEGRGSTTQEFALWRGMSNLAPSDYLFTEAYLQKYRDRHGYEPTPLPIALNVIGIYVHRDNPIAKRGLSLAELDAIFSSTRKRGFHQDIKTWGDLGLQGDWKDQPIRLFVRNKVAGDYKFIKQRALKGGAFKNSATTTMGSAGIIQSIANDQYGIGFAGVGYQTADVAFVPVYSKQWRKDVPPNYAWARMYPLTQPLYVYVMKNPRFPLDPLVLEFVRYMYSREGMEAVRKSGYMPVHEDQAMHWLKQMGAAEEKYTHTSWWSNNDFTWTKQVERYPYRPVKNLKGTYVSIGSDLLNNTMTYMMEDLITIYPNVSAEVEGKGGTNGMPALIKGTSNLCPSSRLFKPRELAAFMEKYGYEPTALPIAADILALYVHKDNPIVKRGLTLEEVDAIYSKTRKGGAAEDIQTWGDLGLVGEWADREIKLFGRNSASGTYGYFKRRALFKGSFKDEVNEMNGSAAVVKAVGSNKGGIGYSGIGYQTDEVVMVPIYNPTKNRYIKPGAGQVEDYLLGRFLYVHLNKDPKKDLSPLITEFVRFMYSRKGAKRVMMAGYYPVDILTSKQALKSVGVTIGHE